MQNVMKKKVATHGRAALPTAPARQSVPPPARLAVSVGPALPSRVIGDAPSYQQDLWQRGVLFLDILRERANNMLDHEQAGLPPQQCERYIEALIDGYRGKEPAYFDAQWLKWHRTLQTLLQTSRALSFQPPGWRKLVVERFAACEVLAASLLSKATV